MKPRPTVFISAVTHEFADFRNAIENEIEKKGCFAENEPGFPPDFRSVEEQLTSKLQDSDVVVCLIGFRFGSEPSQRPEGAPRRSYTQMEFDIAQRLGKPTYRFLSASDSVRDDQLVPIPQEEPEVVQLQTAHRRAIQQSNHLYHIFHDKHELCRLIAEISIIATTDFKADISPIIKYAPEQLIGREAESELLDDAWHKALQAHFPRNLVLTFVALGGEGKTALIAKWAADLAQHGWRGCDCVFAWSFYSQGTRDQIAVSSDLFLSEALTFFGDDAMAGSARSAFDKGRRLAQLVGSRRVLLILDGLEPLQYPPTSPLAGELKDQAIGALLKGLATNSRGLCIVTTRYAIPDLRAFLDKSVREILLTRLSRTAGVALLQAFHIKGSFRQNICNPTSDNLLNEFEKLVEDVKGHALTLNLLGSYLRDAHGGDIRRRDLIKLEEADIAEQGGHAFRVMDAYVESFKHGGKDDSDKTRGRLALAILSLLGLFDRPAIASSLRVLWTDEPIEGLTEPLLEATAAERNVAIMRLEAAKLVTLNRTEGAYTLISLDAHPLIREYFAHRLRDEQPAAWRAAHQRLYEHLGFGIEPGTQPSLEDLQPLYQAVAHGCAARLHQKVYDDVFFPQIQQGNRAYPARKLGVFGSELGAVTCFFDVPWKQITGGFTETRCGNIFNRAAYCLRALGRLTEAIEPMQAGLELCVRQRKWKQAAICASNLSEMTLTLGDVTGAVSHAEESLDYADRTDDTYQQMANSALYADALHQAGRKPHSIAMFRNAVTKLESTFPKTLYSIAGFRECDLLLSDIERACWQALMTRSHFHLENTLSDGITSDAPPTASDRSFAQQFDKVLDNVKNQVEETLRWSEVAKLSHLTIALDHLTLARITLYNRVLHGSDFSLPPMELSHIESAVDGLRRSGQMDDLPRGLLTRAWFRYLSKDHIGSKADLNEAWEIAERGPMRLFMTDIHLYRARLFHTAKPYPWVDGVDGKLHGPQDDLVAARQLIWQCDYWRRKEELYDVEAAIKSREIRSGY